jgi:hypothetical protein
MRTVRKLVLGETWALPIGIAIAVAADWWEDAGGFILLALLACAFVAGLGIRR